MNKILFALLFIVLVATGQTFGVDDRFLSPEYLDYGDADGSDASAETISHEDVLLQKPIDLLNTQNYHVDAELDGWTFGAVDALSNYGEEVPMESQQNDDTTGQQEAHVQENGGQLASAPEEHSDAIILDQKASTQKEVPWYQSMYR